MSYHGDPKCRLCRRAGEKLYLKGERCFTTKCPIVKRNYAPGQHGPGSRTRLSEYGTQLKEKQKVKRTYGIAEQQMRNYFEEAHRRGGETGTNFLQLLESRLDNVVYRLGFSTSRSHARQLITHGHVLVNGKKVSIPSYGVRAQETVRLRGKITETPSFQERLKAAANATIPSWLTREDQTFNGTVVQKPQAQDLQSGFDLQLLVEYYSR